MGGDTMSEELLTRISYLEELDKIHDERLKDLENRLISLSNTEILSPQIPRKFMLSVRISKELNLDVLKAVEEGRYPSKSDFLRDAVKNEIKSSKKEDPDFWHRIEQVEIMLEEARNLIEELRK